MPLGLEMGWDRGVHTVQGDRDTRNHHKQAPSELGSSPHAPPVGVRGWPMPPSRPPQGSPIHSLSMGTVRRG